MALSNLVATQLGCYIKLLTAALRKARFKSYDNALLARTVQQSRSHRLVPELRRSNAWSGNAMRFLFM
jgi:hypothetical protein